MKGFTFIEVLVCVGIIALVSALLSPVYVRTKGEAKVTSSIQRLRQMHLATKMYQENHGGDGNYNSLADANLPPPLVVVKSRLGFSPDFWVSPCDSRPLSSFNRPGSELGYSYSYFPNESGAFSEDLRTYQENTLLLSDFTCDERTRTNGYYTSKRALGVFLSGQLANYTRPGNPAQMKWWINQP